MNLYEVTLHSTESVYLLAPTKYRALELVGDYFAVAGSTPVLPVQPSYNEVGR
ncbi:MAG: hypothetical protein ABSB35_25560 [Bryobacteraceae bacterium]|jgi:hypothetical protein